MCEITSACIKALKPPVGFENVRDFFFIVLYILSRVYVW